ncbi:hypothetical protein NOG12_12915 [Pseudidiomarina sp. GXY010]|uniref:Lipoprotein n=1 Tax=Pseudidiomarina fusca TaxID=2965078 RepID=A0ABU3KZP4_9GAMM|nr:hypothetical protein [Pseudidiomarina sp. GXY010]MDT7526968.1 hypothetical protein [Pseudidiomarina sp. GXY010]
MKQLSIIIFIVLLACTDEDPKFIKWHGFSIPTAYVLGEIGGSGLYSIGAEERDDIAIELRSNVIDGNYVQYTLTLASNISNGEAKTKALNLAKNGGVLKKHESGLYKLSENNTSIHWQLVSPTYEGTNLIGVEPVAECSQLKSSPESCVFGFVDSDVYYTVSLSGRNISNYREVRELLKAKLSMWAVH